MNGQLFVKKKKVCGDMWRVMTLQGGMKVKVRMSVCDDDAIMWRKGERCRVLLMTITFVFPCHYAL